MISNLLLMEHCGTQQTLIFEDGDLQWENFSSSVYQDLETDDWYRLFIQRNGSVWVSSWGRGLLEVHPLEDTLIWTRWDHRNAPLDLLFDNNNGGKLFFLPSRTRTDLVGSLRTLSMACG